MGTRHLIAVVSNNEYKIAQYGQWDGYPEGQGIQVLDFLRSNDLNEFKKTLENVRFITQEEWDEIIRNHTDDGSVIYDSEHAKYWDTHLRHFSRDASSEILHLVNNIGITVVRSSLPFAGDSLFCEWAYVIDLDTDTLEVYRGFNKEPITTGRFKSDDPELDTSKDYEPVKLIKEYKLNDLPTEEQFLEDLTEEEEAA